MPPVTTLAPGLVAAYRAARYEVRLRRRMIRLRVDAPSPRAMSRWFGGARGGVFVTAAAPRGIPRHPAAERAAFRRLAARMLRAGQRFLPGEGGDEAGAWPAEASLLIALSCAAHAAPWGRRYGQNAVLWVPRRGAVRLVLLR